ncbi:MAG: diguanylate cyclase, partial [Parvibaculum sp.]
MTNEAEQNVQAEVPSASLSAEALGHVGDAYYEWTLEHDALTWAPHAGELLGISAEQSLSTGRAYAARVVPRKGTTRFEEIVSGGRRDNGQGVAYQIEYVVRDDQGEERWVEDRGRWFGNAEGRPKRAVGLVRIVTHRRQRDEELTYLASYDELTGHLNRLRLRDVLSDSLGDLRRFGRQGAYFVVAIDNLSLINEAYGFDVADRLIVEVGRRLLGQLRSSDVIGRTSGNKF